MRVECDPEEWPCRICKKCKDCIESGMTLCTVEKLEKDG